MRAQMERQERVLKAARAYIRAGYRPVPIPAGEKACAYRKLRPL
jgi:hypothetical protein